MRIEEEIKQKKFKNEYEKLSVNLLFTVNWMNDSKLQLLKPLGLTLQQYNILRILRGQYPEPATVGLLCERMLDRMSNASRIVERLRMKGLVERTECRKDRRAVDVLITSEGLEILERAEKEVDELVRNLDVLSYDEAQEMNRLLDKIRE